MRVNDIQFNEIIAEGLKAIVKKIDEYGPTLAEKTVDPNSGLTVDDLVDALIFVLSLEDIIKRGDAIIAALKEKQGV